MHLKEVQIKNKTLKLPIIQGGMGIGISLSRLAGNMAKLGGMGVLSAAHPGYKHPDFLKEPLDTNLNEMKNEIKKAKKIANGNGLVACNLMVAMNNYNMMVQAVIAGGADAIISGAGLPLDLPRYTKGHEIAICPIVSSGRALKLILRTWDRKYQTTADFIVLEGSNAGGHLGFKDEELRNHTCHSLEALLAEVLEVKKEYEEKYNHEIPVFVAGGVYDGKEVVHYMNKGASGVQMATRFICSEECDADYQYKEAFVNAKKEDVVLVKSPVGMTARALNNSFVQKVNKGQKIEKTRCFNCIKTCDPKITPYCITEALIRAVQGDVEDGLIFCGAKAYLNHEIKPLKEIVEDILKEAQAS